jgi:carbonic anhydrase/acetyltransferase-like protein (isoleucine patch superfamily)
MLKKTFQNIEPTIAPDAYVAENATVIGMVTLESGSSIWYNCVLRGDVEPIIIGENSNIQDGVIAHTSHGTVCRVGKNVTVGHGAILHSCDVADNCLIGMGAILLSGCVIGEGSLIAAGALVPEGRVIPPNSVVMGCPGKIVRQTTDADRESFAISAVHYLDNAKQQFGDL